MRILHMDWETTDLYLKGAPSEDPKQPWPCSVSAILDDHDGRTLSGFYSLIKVPPGTVWAPKAYEANRLSAAICNEFGQPLQTIMETLERWASLADALCAFSAYFELKFLKIGCAKIGDDGRMRARFEGLQRMCTMETSARYLKGEGQRFIKLTEAHRQIIGREFDDAHNALADNQAQRRVYMALRDKGVTDFSDTKVLNKDYSKPAPSPSTPRPKSDPARATAIADGIPAAKSALRKPTAIKG